MGYLNKSTVTVDAILTKRGRQLLAQGANFFNITKFAVADDEIDYGLYNPGHPLGSEYYGSAIENMPVVEAFPDETQNMKYKLVTYPRSVLNVIPTISTIPNQVLTYRSTAGSASDTKTIDLQTNPSTYETDGYTVIIYNNDIVDLQGDGRSAGATATVPSLYANVATTKTKVVQANKQVTITAKYVASTTTTQLVVIGNATGATTTISVTVNPESTT